MDSNQTNIEDDDKIDGGGIVRTSNSTSTGGNGDNDSINQRNQTDAKDDVIDDQDGGSTTNTNTNVTSGATSMNTTNNITDHTQQHKTMKPLPQCSQEDENSTRSVSQKDDPIDEMKTTHTSSSIPTNKTSNEKNDNNQNKEEIDTTNAKHNGTSTATVHGDDNNDGNKNDVNDDDNDNLNNNDNDNDDKLKTLTQIVNYLKDIQINDDLDEDEMVIMMTTMNDASRKRRRHRRWLMRDQSKGYMIHTSNHHYESDPEDYWNDDDVLHEHKHEHKHGQLQSSKRQQQMSESGNDDHDYNQIAINAMINVVDDKFFSNTIDETEERSKQTLNDDVVTTLRTCLAISNGKGSKYRKRRDMRVPINTNTDTKTNTAVALSTPVNNLHNEDNNHSSESSEGGIEKNRRRTRQMAHKSKAKRIDDLDDDDNGGGGSSEIQGLDSLVAAMIDIEEIEGRSVNIDFDDFIHQGRRLRVRGKGNTKDTPKKGDQSHTPVKTAPTTVATTTATTTAVAVAVEKTKTAQKKKKSKKKKISEISENNIIVPPSESKDELKEKDDSLYAILPSENQRRRSARRAIEQKAIQISSIIVDGNPFTLTNEHEAENARKRSYKKRRPYVKRGPYKKRKKNEEDVAVEEASDDTDQSTQETEAVKSVLSKKRKAVDDKVTSQTTSNDCGPVSLSLLDWRRRHRWKGRKMNERDHSYISSEMDLIGLSNTYPPGIDASMVSWESMNKLAEEDPNQPPTMEPSRKRHSSNTYGNWCSRLVNCLQGKGRIFARHEFFYSDIDKAWFNENPFAMDLMKLGLSADVMLTRSEWSAVRRKVRKKPKLFSKKFLNAQLSQLQKYRETVRMIQVYGKEIDCVKHFRFEVLTAPKVGSTVTAYHRRSRLIHRGTVLAHNQISGVYLIQFERRELGWDWVRDIEVASHGVPELLISKPNPHFSCTNSKSNPKEVSAEHGSLPQGTIFGPLIDFYKRDTQLSTRTAKFLAQRKNAGVIKTVSSQSNLLNRVAERESLAKLMNIIDSSLERKEAILDVIDKFHHLLEGNKDAKQHFQKGDLKDHYDWLLESLRLTDQALEAALVHQQIMYGKIYAGMSMVPPTVNNKRQIVPTSQAGKKWGQILSQGAAEIGSELAQRAFENVLCSNPTHEGTKVISNTARNEFISNRITSSVEVLLTSELLCKKSHPQNKTREMHQDAVKIMRKTVSSLTQTLIPQLPKEINSTMKIRESALCDLKESLNMLESELMVTV